MQLCKTDLGQASASIKIFIGSKDKLPFQEIVYGTSLDLSLKKDFYFNTTMNKGKVSA